MNYVSSIQDTSVVLERLDNEEWILPSSLTAPPDNTTTLSVPFATDAELARLLGSLRDHGVAFGSELAGWPPAAVFEDLRTRGLVSGPYLELLFSGPGRWTTRQK